MNNKMSLVAPKCIIRPRNKVIAVDIDEVLCQFVKPLMKWRGLKPDVEKYHPYVFSTIMNISEQESQQMVQEFYNTEEFANLTPLSGAQAGIAYLKGRGHRLYAVTGRQSSVRTKTETWLDTHFPYAFDDLVITNSYTPCEIAKSDICRALNIGIIIDDNLRICMECESQHIRSVNFIGDPIYPWCQDNELAVRKWDDIICSTIV
tara:strand:- start:526 stop:1140 length:615 start_codon:yes stop_codon:yes gene_type:complete